MKNKFKVGDIIRAIHPDFYGITNSKNKWIGEVIEIDIDGLLRARTLQCDSGDKDTFSDLHSQYFELVNVYNSEIRITVIGNDTIAVMKRNGEVVKTAVAKCSPKDELDFEKGAKFAFKRLFKENEPKDKKKFQPYLILDATRSIYGIIGTPTKYKDIVDRPLFVGDTVDLFDSNNVYHCETLIAESDGDQYIMGIRFDCLTKKGKIKNFWKIIKKRSYKDIQHGEKVYDIRYVLKEEKCTTNLKKSR